MKEGIVRQAELNEFFIDEGCFITELSNDGERGISVARARVEPGVTTVRHLLNGVDEQYLIISGQGRAEVGVLPATDVGPGDLVNIPAGTAQRITNTGDHDLIFYCICRPGFIQSSYQSVLDKESD